GTLHDIRVLGRSTRNYRSARATGKMTRKRVPWPGTLSTSRPTCQGLPAVLASIRMQVSVTEQNGMLDRNRDINSLSDFKRNTAEFLRQLRETGQPVVLTINGEAELVVQDTTSYQKLVEIAERAAE